MKRFLCQQFRRLYFCRSGVHIGDSYCSDCGIYLDETCSCFNMKCECTCLSGGYKDGQIVQNVCLNSLCKKHTQQCIVR